MALGLKDILFLFMGIIAICLVISFGAYQLTTYGSVRGIVGQIALQPTQIVNLHSQYGEMTDQFANTQANTYTYQWGSQSIDVSKTQVSGKSEQQAIGIVLDKYADNLYHGHVTGDLATASSISGAGANGLYFIIAILMFAAMVIILALSFIQQWYESTKEMLKSAGKIILVASVVTFIILLIAPPIIESVMWDSINSNDWGREVNTVIAPIITGTFLVDTLIIILFGALLYGVGFLFHINTGEGEVDAGAYLRSTPKRTPNAAPRIKDDPGMNKSGRKQL